MCCKCLTTKETFETLIVVDRNMERYVMIVRIHLTTNIKSFANSSIWGERDVEEKSFFFKLKIESIRTSCQCKQANKMNCVFNCIAASPPSLSLSISMNERTPSHLSHGDTDSNYHISIPILGIVSISIGKSKKGIERRTQQRCVDIFYYNYVA